MDTSQYVILSDERAKKLFPRASLAIESVRKEMGWWSGDFRDAPCCCLMGEFSLLVYLPRVSGKNTFRRACLVYLRDRSRAMNFRSYGGFGRAAMIGGVNGAHHKETGKWVIERGEFVRVDDESRTPGGGHRWPLTVGNLGGFFLDNPYASQTGVGCLIWELYLR